MTSIYDDSDSICDTTRLDTSAAWELKFFGHSRLLVSASLSVVYDEFIRSKYPDANFQDMMVFEWNTDSQLGCFYLQIGNLKYTDVTQIQDHTAGIFIGKDIDGIIDEVPFSFNVDADIQEKYHLKNRKFTLNEYNEMSNSFGNSWNKIPYLIAITHDTNNDEVICPYCTYKSVGRDATYQLIDGSQRNQRNPFTIGNDKKIQVIPNLAETLDADTYSKILFDLEINPLCDHCTIVTETIEISLKGLNDKHPTLNFTENPRSNVIGSKNGEVKIFDGDIPNAKYQLNIVSSVFTIKPQATNLYAFDLILLNEIKICAFPATQDDEFTISLMENNVEITRQTFSLSSIEFNPQMCFLSGDAIPILAECPAERLLLIKVYHNFSCPSAIMCNMNIAVNPSHIKAIQDPQTRNIFHICADENTCTEYYTITACDENLDCFSEDISGSDCGVCIWCIMFLVLLYLFLLFLLLILLFIFKIWCCSGWISRFFDFWICCGNHSGNKLAPTSFKFFWTYWFLLLFGWLILLTLLCLGGLLLLSSAVYLFFFWLFPILLLLLLLYLWWWTYRYQYLADVTPIAVHTEEDFVQAKEEQQTFEKPKTVTRTKTIVKHSETAYLVQQKKARPRGDLGQILGGYVELADQEEYAFNATFKSQLSSDNMVSFPNLTQIGTDETYNIENMESTVNATMLNTTTRANNVKSNLDITFLVDGSDSFNESVSKTEDGFQVILKWISQFMMTLSNQSNYENLTSSCYQFSGLKQAGAYMEGSGGIDQKSKMLHYELFFGPMEITQRSLEVFEDILEGVTPLGGSDFFYLCLNDILLDLKKRKTKETDAILVVLSDGDWDDGNVVNKSDRSVSSQDVKFRAQKFFEQIHFMIAPSPRFSNNQKELLELQFQKPKERPIFMINAFSGLSEQLNRGGTEVMNIISDGREVLV